jgi:hypothetical protein
VETDPGEVRIGRRIEAEEILKEENQRPGFAGRIREIPPDRQIWEKVRGI